ncbi:MAG: hypothetical protein WDN30_14415 [Pararobbsia sp.]
MSGLSTIEQYAIYAMAGVALAGIGFCTGYLYRAHSDEVAAAADAATVKTAEAVGSAVISGSDNRAFSKMQSSLDAANRRAAALQKQISDASHANPAPADCRLPDGLRESINGDLSGGAGQVQDSVR